MAPIKSKGIEKQSFAPSPYRQKARAEVGHSACRERRVISGEVSELNETSDSDGTAKDPQGSLCIQRTPLAGLESTNQFSGSILQGSAG